MRKCEDIGGVAAAGTAIKRKIGYSDGEFSYSTTSIAQRRRILRRVPGEIENTKNKEDSSSNDQCNSCCSSHWSTGINKQNSELSDLELQKEQEEATADISTSTYGSERRETTALSGGVAESFEPKAKEKLPSEGNSRSISDEVMMPPANTGLLEEDFSVAEKDLAVDMKSNCQSCEVEMPLANTEVEEHFSVADEKVLTVDVNSICQFNEVKMPSMAELEEFFSVAENDLTQQFSNKYNFDFVKEEPLEGRYEWVPVKP